MQALYFFDTLQQARDYRYQHGTGGWIFAPDASDTAQRYPMTQCIIFPPDMTPSHIFHHPATKGRSGRLIGN